MRILGRIITSLNKPEVINNEVFVKEYRDEIIETRNELAHCVESFNEDKKVLVARTGDKIFDDSTCKDLRKNIRKHSKYLDVIEAII